MNVRSLAFLGFALGIGASVVTSACGPKDYSCGPSSVVSGEYAFSDGSHEPSSPATSGRFEVDRDADTLTLSYDSTDGPATVSFKLGGFLWEDEDGGGGAGGDSAAQ